MEEIIEYLNHNVVGFILLAIAAIGSGVTFWKKVIKPTYDVFIGVFIRYSDIMDKLKILDELKPNGGSSIKDTLTRMETRLVKSVHLNQAVMNSMGIPYFITNPHGEITEVGRSLCRLLGRNEDEIIANNWLSWVHNHAQVLSNWKYCVDNHMDFTQTVIFKRLNGESVLVEVVAYQLGQSGNYGYYGTMRESIPPISA